jgi:DNA-binding response OmpR family regulator
MSPPSSLLLVDSDSAALETLTFGFEREGYKVTATADFARAIELSRHATPDLAVIALRQPSEQAVSTVAGIRAAVATLPVVALGAAALRPEALAAGASAFLALPIFMRDVVSVGRLAAIANRTAKGKPEAKSRDGNAAPETTALLSEFFGLFYLLRAMAASERSGVVMVTRGNRRAEIRVHEGAVVSANVGPLQGLPALHRVLLWEEAALSLTDKPVPARNQLHLSEHEVLDECERFLRDFAHAARDLGSPQTLYVPAAEPGAALPGMQQSQVTPLLKLFDGHRALAEVIEESPFRIFDTVRMIRRLRETGALVVRPDGLSQERPIGAAAHVPRPTGPLAPTPVGQPASMLGQWAMVPDQRGVVGNRRATSRPSRPLGGGATLPPTHALGTAAAPIPLTTIKVSGTAPAAAGEIAARRRPSPAHVANVGEAPTVQVRLDATGMPIGPITSAASAALADPAPLSAPSAADAPPGAPIPLVNHKTPVPGRARSETGLRGSGGDAPPQRRPSSAARLQALEDGRSPRGASGGQVSLDKAHAQNGQHSLELPMRARRGSGASPSSETFDPVEADFFAREADLYKREPIETFDDLDPMPGIPSNKSRRK